MADGEKEEPLYDGCCSDEFFCKMAFEVIKPLRGMSIAQAEAVLKEAQTVLKNSIFIKIEDVDEVKRRFVLPFGQQGQQLPE
jgi:hypothetical protein